jgi:Flp pilus assembly protein TadG
MSIRSRRQRSSRRGAALVEFAFVAPVFLLFVVGMIEIGRAIIVQQELINASREGARVAGYDSTMLTSTVTSAVNTYLSNVGITGATTVVSPNPPSGASDGQQVSVTVSIGYNQVSWVPSPFFLRGQTLQTTSVMCREPAP